MRFSVDIKSVFLVLAVWAGNAFSAPPPAPYSHQHEIRAAIDSYIIQCQPAMVTGLLRDPFGVVNDPDAGSAVGRPGTSYLTLAVGQVSTATHCQGDSLVMVKLLLDAGADPNLGGVSAPLSAAAAIRDSSLSIATIKLLVAHGADVNLQFRSFSLKRNVTVLNVEFEQRQYVGNEQLYSDLISLLADAHFQFNAVDADGKTQLMSYVEFGSFVPISTALVKLLLDHGTPLDAKDSDGLSAADWSLLSVENIAPKPSGTILAGSGPRPVYRCTNVTKIHNAAVGFQRDLAARLNMHKFLVQQGAVDRDLPFQLPCTPTIPRR